MTQEEWDEMNVLRKAMTDNLASVHPDKQERFTQLRYGKSPGLSAERRSAAKKRPRSVCGVVTPGIQVHAGRGGRPAQ